MSKPERGIDALYHYTSVEALRNIVETKVLRATSVAYLNDAQEGLLGMATINLLASEMFATHEMGKAGQRFLAYLLNNWHHEFENSSVFVMCFSESANQLSQWRGYSPHGRGVCIQFNTGALVDRMQAIGWTFQRCCYEPEERTKWAKAILSRMMREATTEKPASVTDEHHFAEVVSRNSSDLHQIATQMKSHHFREEAEVRFMSPLIALADPCVKYREGRTTLIPYVEFTLMASPDDALPIREVLIGPSPSEQLTFAAVNSLLLQDRKTRRAKPAPIGVGLSQIPYREL